MPELADQCVIVNGVAKTYAMTGWRVGWMIGPSDVMKASINFQSHSTSNPCSITQAAGVVALNGPQEFLQTWKASFAARRNLVAKALNDISGLTCKVPEGAFYVFPSMKGLIGKKTPQGKTIETDKDFCDYLLEHALVAAVFGKAFGMEGYFRISYATSEKVLVEAMSRIKKVCAELK